MYKIKTLNKISKTGLDCLDTAKYTFGDDVADAEAILVRSAAMHEMEFEKSLLAIGRAGAGTNNIPVDRCASEGIVVFNTPGANANAVKELVIAGLFLTSRKIVAGIEWAKTLKGHGDAVKKEIEKGKSAFTGPEVKGKKLGVIGLGAIGVNVANTALALGMDVYGYDPFLSVDTAWHVSDAIHHATDIKEIFENCDYITLHIPLNDKTRDTINAETIATMVDGVRILNFARGELVNTDAIKTALADGKVSAYVTDFPNDDLLCVDGVIAIPHLGASTPESEDNCAKMAVQEVVDYIENGNITHSVNLPDVSAPRATNCRVCVIHKNIPNMLSQMSGVFSAKGENIENMLNKSRGDFAYTIMDVDDATDETVSALTAIDGIIRVRVIK